MAPPVSWYSPDPHGTPVRTTVLVLPGVDDPATGTVYTGDTFGLVYPALQRSGRFVLASTSPTDFDPVEARRSVDRVLAVRL